VQKGSDGEDLLAATKEFQDQSETIFKTLRVSIDTPVVPKALYQAYLSGFPLLPLNHIEFEEYGGKSLVGGGPISRARLRLMRKALRIIGSMGEKGQVPAHIRTAIDRFSQSFRHRHLEQSVVDLVVALEALFGVDQEELRRRLARNVAYVLGVGDSQRETIYRRVGSAYKLRNAIVHGKRNQAKEMSTALRSFFPDLPDNAEQSTVLLYLERAVDALQGIVRSALRAYIHLHTHSPDITWPDSEQLDILPFRPHELRILQRRLGVLRARRPTA